MTMLKRDRSTVILAGILASAGVAHFVIPKPFDQIVPTWMPGSARLWTQASGVAELAVASLVAGPRTRSFGGKAAAVLFLAVFPANIQMAVDWWPKGGAQRIGSLARLPFQLPLVLLARKVAKTCAPPRTPQI
jgi:uncharacterized membrane protein